MIFTRKNNLLSSISGQIFPPVRSIFFSTFAYYVRRALKRRINSRRVRDLLVTNTRSGKRGTQRGAELSHHATILSMRSEWQESRLRTNTITISLTTFERNRIKIGFRWYSLSLFLFWCRSLLPLARPNRCIYVRLIDSTSSKSTFRRTTEKWKHRWKSSNPSLDLTLEINGSGQRWSPSLLLLLFFFFQPPLCVPSFSITWKATRRSPLRTRLYFHDSVLRRRVEIRFEK